MSSLADFTEHPLALLTASIPGIGGELKITPEDFIVEEIPIYLPTGDGEHLFLWVEKNDISAEQLLQHISKTLHISRDDIGVAGLKDRRAVTRQWVSVPVGCEAHTENLNTPQIKVLESCRHGNKLKTGHLRGNRFTVVVRNCVTGADELAMQIQQQIQQLGIPNYFGSQRFGIDGETLQTGQDLLSGVLDPQRIPRQRRKFLTRLALSAVQSALYNAILSARIDQGTTHQVQYGDVLQVVQSGGPFVSTEPAVDQLRFEQREVVTTGPLFGPKMKQPAPPLLEFELDFLQRCGLTLDDFSKFKKLTSGARRPLLLWLDDLEVISVDNGLQFSFSLPSGAYATVVLREFMKNE